MLSQDAVQDQLASSDLIAELEILDRVGEADPLHGVRSVSTARILRVLRGETSPGRDIVIETIGGELEGMGMMVPGLPRPYAGRQYRAYLRDEGASDSIGTVAASC